MVGTNITCYVYANYERELYCVGFLGLFQEFYCSLHTASGTHTVKICQPKCTDECINGICIEVDTCTCKDGYEFVKDSFTECEPVCDPRCLNGRCIEPNVCSCEPGREMTRKRNDFLFQYYNFQDMKSSTVNVVHTVIRNALMVSACFRINANVKTGTF